MARLWHSGFEGGSVDVFTTLGLGIGGPEVPAVDAAVTRGAWSAYSCRLGQGAYGERAIPASTELFVRVPFRAGGGTPIEPFVHFRQGGATQVMLKFNEGVIQAKRGSGGSEVHLGTATNPAIGEDEWVLIEARVVFSNAAGIVQVKVDGDLVLDLSGIDTVSTATPNCDAVRFSCETSSRRPYYYDDLAINDAEGPDNNTWIGDGKTAALLPSGAGSATDFTRAGADSGANHSQVEERPPNDATDYVQASDVGDRDLYALTDALFGSRINAIVAWNRAKKSDAGAASLKAVVAVDGDEDEGPVHALTVAWAYYGDIFERAPDGTKWTQEALDAIEAGFEIA